MMNMIKQAGKDYLKLIAVVKIRRTGHYNTQATIAAINHSSFFLFLLLLLVVCLLLFFLFLLLLA
jgi:hypothetical protein